MAYKPVPFICRKSAGAWSLYPISTTSTDSFYILSNQTDAYPYIRLTGNDYILLAGKSGSAVLFNDGATQTMRIYRSGTNSIIESLINNNDLNLLTTGSGVLKFGTHTGSGDVACNGSIAIKDAGGTTRKLMTTA